MVYRIWNWNDLWWICNEWTCWNFCWMWNEEVLKWWMELEYYSVNCKWLCACKFSWNQGNAVWSCIPMLLWNLLNPNAKLSRVQTTFSSFDFEFPEKDVSSFLFEFDIPSPSLTLYLWNPNVSHSINLDELPYLNIFKWMNIGFLKSTWMNPYLDVCMSLAQKTLIFHTKLFRFCLKEFKWNPKKIDCTSSKPIDQMKSFAL